MEATLRPVWRGGGFRPRGLRSVARAPDVRCLANRGSLRIQIGHNSKRRKLSNFREGQLTISKKGRPNHGDIGNWTTILPKKPPPVLNFEHAKQSSFRDAIWRDPEEGPHIARPNLKSAFPGENTMYPRTGGTQRERELVGLHNKLGTTEDGPSAHTKITCLVCRAFNNALRVKACFAGRVLGNFGTRQDNRPVVTELCGVCLLENLPSGGVRLDSRNKGNGFSLERGLALSKSFRNRTINGVSPAALPSGIEGAA